MTDMREKEKHKEALEYFIEIFWCDNITRTFQKIADRFGVSERTIWNWYRELNWKQRSAKRLERKRKEDEKKWEKKFIAEYLRKLSEK